MQASINKTWVAAMAALTLLVGWGSFALAMPAFNRLNNQGALANAYASLLLPIALQIVWLGAGFLVSSRKQRSEIVGGILLGFALEFLVLLVLVLRYAAAHY